MADQRLGTQSRLSLPRVGCTIFQVPIHDVTYAETVAHVGQWITQEQVAQIATVNPEFLVYSREEPQFRAALQRAALCIPDGIGVLWAARLQGRKLRERVAGSDLGSQTRLACLFPGSSSECRKEDCSNYIWMVSGLECSGNLFRITFSRRGR